MVGWLPLFAPANTPSQRSVMNIGFINANEYRFIDHVKLGEGWGPNGSSWSTSTPVWNQSLGSNGYPNIRITNAMSKSFGTGIRIPSSNMYGAPGTSKYYVLKWKGSGEISLALGSGSWTWGTTEQALSSNASFVSTGRWKTTSGVDAKIVVGYTGPAQLFGLYIYASDEDTNNGSFVNSVQFYRLDDETDLTNGNIFRMPYKTAVKNLCPSAIRFMDWVGGNFSLATRFDKTRTLPSNPVWSNAANWQASPAYGPMAYTGIHQFTTSSVTGMPVSYTHGETVTVRADTGLVRCGHISITKSGTGNITNASNGIVTTDSTTATGNTNGTTTISNISPSGLSVGQRLSGTNISANAIVTAIDSGNSQITISIAATGSATGTTFIFGHCFNSNDVIAHRLNSMPKLNMLPCTITVTGPTTYQLGVDTTLFGTFTGTATADQYVTLNVGGRGDVPIIISDGETYVSTFGNGSIALGDYKTFVYDKTLSNKTDGSGNFVYGVWILGLQNASLESGIPLEVCVALVNEVNALGPAQTIGMWMNIPFMGTSSMDPDATTGANWGANAVNVVMNGSTVSGVTYQGLQSNAKLFIEYSNETWNSGGAFAGTRYLWRRGFLRWPASGTTDGASMTSLRSTVAMEDIKASGYYNASRMRFVLGLWGSRGATDDTNLGRIDGTSYYLNDAANIWGASSPPMAHHDYTAFAAYIEPSDTFVTANLATYVASWVSHIGNAVSQEADCANYVVGMTSFASGGSETTGNYGNTNMPAYANKMGTYGKYVVMYEGGWNPSISARSGGGQTSVSLAFTAGAMTNGNTTITGVDASYVSTLATGDFVYGYGIAANTRVSSASGTSIVLTIAPTVSLTTGQFICLDQTNAFLWAVKNSQAWNDAYIAYLNQFNRANAGMPSDYVAIDLRWGHNYPDAYGIGNTEWGSLDKLWISEGARNRALSA